MDFYCRANKSALGTINPWIGSAIIFPLALYYVINAGSFTFIDYLNLLLHEGGHGIFRVFGKFIYTLGGSLMQIIIPSMFIVFYWFKKKRFLAQIFLIWLGENLMNISTYVSDARTQQLPLLGGNKVYHDWNYLLGVTGLLKYDTVFSNMIFICGVIMFLLALLIPLFIRDYQTAEVNLNI